MIGAFERAGSGRQAARSRVGLLNQIEQVKQRSATIRARDCHSTKMTRPKSWQRVGLLAPAEPCARIHLHTGRRLRNVGWRVLCSWSAAHRRLGAQRMGPNRAPQPELVQNLNRRLDLNLEGWKKIFQPKRGQTTFSARPLCAQTRRDRRVSVFVERSKWIKASSLRC